jgi:hypothetical protein
MRDICKIIVFLRFSALPQTSVSGTYPEPHESGLDHHIGSFSFEIIFNIILEFTLMNPNWVPSFGVFQQNFYDYFICEDYKLWSSVPVTSYRFDRNSLLRPSVYAHPMMVSD